MYSGEVFIRFRKKMEDGGLQVTLDDISRHGSTGFGLAFVLPFSAINMDSSCRPRRYLTAEEILELMNQADSDLNSLSDDDEDYLDNVELNDDDDDDEDEDDDDISILDLISSSNPEKWGIHTDAFPAPTSNFCQKSGVNYSSSNQMSIFWNT
ncbi:hypothetical protein AVEN_238119-1 [Araneus ventricosus]|uniref:Uncharacterized protein n=1 Tax=Araneus ventricosus TaxID=182803 RepID=A0A4Y2JUF8_ARAVE|nr:hypothetical protein AVEN_230154-1 [Araneus ventricosus]GBM93717.1 hypothetical protein AVEN_238119-1 [Araneus ventricosus]